jgi:hypothetical protein
MIIWAYLFGPAVKSTPAIAIKSDELRLLGKKGIRMISDGGDAYLSAKNTYLSDKSSGTEPMVLRKNT